MSRFSEFEEKSILSRSGAVNLFGHKLAHLKERHSESPRAYHNWDHVLDFLSHLIRANAGRVLSTDDLEYCTAAALFHDAVYDPSAPPGFCEEMSAGEAAEHLGKDDFSIGLILATARHGQIERRDIMLDGRYNGVTAIFLDCDMVSLAEPHWARFKENNDNIEAEYLSVYSEEEVRTGRREFLVKLLAKETIFLSDFFGRQHEWQARLNVQRLLRSMS